MTGPSGDGRRSPSPPDAPHAQEPAAVLEALETEPGGLSAQAAKRRHEVYGPNAIESDERRAVSAILLAQFDSALIWVLLAAALLSVWAGHVVDAILITGIVALNGLFGFAQEFRAEESLESLRAMAAPVATVRRDEAAVDRPATELVPGDVIELEAGDVVPADARLLDVHTLEVDEAPLTGESTPVSKGVEPTATDAPLAERPSMVYKGTNVTRGSATAVVASTGMDTAIGDIATALARTEDVETPLQRELDRLGRRLGVGVLLLAALVVPLLLLRGTDAVQAGLTAISLAVAAVPEGLPAVVTLTLALGVRTMAREHALIRHLPAVEGLGSVDVICTDKTGTLTEGRMRVRRVWVDDAVIDVGGGSSRVDEDAPVLLDVFRAGALCNDATMEAGDPTERALVEVAEQHGIDVAALRADRPRTDEIPFASARKWMATLHDGTAYLKGAPTVILERSTHVQTPAGRVRLDASRRERIAQRVDAFADDALRVLAVARAPMASVANDDLEAPEGLTLLGLVGMLDPPRPEVADAIAATRRAGIEVKVITGDNARTARAVAGAIGLGTTVIEGSEIEAYPPADLGELVASVDVFARTTPAHKVSILEALQANGHVVAMTGDGVNDAPALKNADIGVAMGIRGTEVAQRASDLILLDDNYATIERAVGRGRAIFDNIWKFVAYLLSANLAEVAIVFLASLGGYLILPAVQLLWINLLTDGLPALALGADPESGDVMDRPPRDPERGIVDREMLGLMVGTGAISSVAMLALMAYTLAGAPAVTPYAMTMVFTGFVVLEFEKLYVIRWLRETPTFSNRWLAVAVASSVLLQLAVLYTPLNEHFGTVPLGIADWALLGLVLLFTLPAYLGVVTALRRTGVAAAAT